MIYNVKLKHDSQHYTFPLLWFIEGYNFNK